MKRVDHRPLAIGPVLVTPDELPGGVRPDLAISLTVDDEVMQKDSTADLLFDPIALVEYVSTMIRLNPGDVVATGTPGSGPRPQARPLPHRRRDRRHRDRGHRQACQPGRPRGLLR